MIWITGPACGGRARSTARQYIGAGDEVDVSVALRTGTEVPIRSAGATLVKGAQTDAAGTVKLSPVQIRN